MSLAAIRPGSFGFRYSTSPTGAQINVTGPGGSSSEGAWAQIAAAANITDDVYYLIIGFGNGSTSGLASNWVCDIGIDPAGGTSYTEVISNVGAAGAISFGSGGVWFLFPIFIPAGSSVAVRAVSSLSDTIGVQAQFLGGPSHPFAHRKGAYSETIGVTGAGGVAITSGASGTEGAWTSIGTTARDLWWWQVCLGINDSSQAAQTYSVDLAWGDASNKHLLLENNRWVNTTTESTNHVLDPFGWGEVPAGSTIYARVTSSGASPDTGLNIIAVGIGGG